MNDREYYIDFWTPTIGAEEAAKSWEIKQSGFRLQAPMVAGDIQPYQSMIDGSIINSRSEHRSHLKAHGCIEVGNETKHIKPRKPLESPPGLKDELVRVVNQKMR
jgi:hypothetical protein